MKKSILVALVALMALSFSVVFSGCAEQSKSAESAEPERVTVEDQEITIKIRNWDDSGKALKDYEERTGTYSGETIDGIPDGTGTFTTKNPEGETWIYEGEFINGMREGLGKMWFPDSEDFFIREGHFKDSAFVPTKAELIKSFGTYDNHGYKLSQTSQDFIDNNDSIFPAVDEEAKAKAIELSDDNVTIKELHKSLGKHEGKLFSKAGLYVGNIYEYGTCGYDMTEIEAFDSNYENCYYIFYFGTIDVYEGDYINFRGLPIANSSFDNVSGGSTNDTVFVGSIVEKK